MPLNKTITIRITGEEKKSLEQSAKKWSKIHGVKIGASTYARTIIFKKGESR